MKSATDWSKNPSAEANQFAYNDATVAYDSSVNNYDGVVDSDMSDREISPTGWSGTPKTPTGWLPA